MKFLSDRYAKVLTHKEYAICVLRVAVPSEGDDLGYRIDDKKFEGRSFSNVSDAIDAIN